MAFLAPIAVELSGWTLRKILPWAICACAILGLSAALWVEVVRLDAARAALSAARHDDEIAQADAKRWAVAGARMQKIIDDQAAQLSRQAANLAGAARVADDLAAAQAKKISVLSDQIDALKARAHAHPDQARPLGPIVTDVLASLHKRVGG